MEETADRCLAERVYLLVHILKMVILPNHRQHPDIQKLNLDTRKLKEVTIEAMTPFWNDKDLPANAKKKPYLDEIFRVARHEERYLDGQIGGCMDDKTPVARAVLTEHRRGYGDIRRR